MEFGLYKFKLLVIKAKVLLLFGHMQHFVFCLLQRLWVICNNPDTSTYNATVSIIHSQIPNAIKPTFTKWSSKKTHPHQVLPGIGCLLPHECLP